MPAPVRLVATCSHCALKPQYTMTLPTLSSLPFASRRKSSRSREIGFEAEKRMLRASGESRTIWSAGMRSEDMIDACVVFVAVAVSARIGGGPGKLVITEPNRKYEGLKLCDHSLTQCASSTHTRLTPRGQLLRRLEMRLLENRSGERNSTSISPL